MGRSGAFDDSSAHVVGGESNAVASGPSKTDIRRAMKAAHVVARRNHGVVTREEALAAGLPRTRVDWLVHAGSWKAIFPGVYRIQGSAETRFQRIASVVAWAGENAVVSHHTAAELWGLEGIKQRRFSVHVSRHNVGKKPPRGNITFHRSRKMEVGDTGERHGFVVTTPLRTIIDLASELSEPELERLMLSAIRKKLLAAETLIAWERGGVHRGIRDVDKIRNIVARQAILLRTESPLEDEILQVLVDADLRPSASQGTLFDALEKIGEFDLLFAEARLLIEVDGAIIHDVSSVQAKDAEKDARAAVLGYAVVRARREHLFGAKRAEFIQRVRRELDRSGERTQYVFPYARLEFEEVLADGTRRRRRIETGRTEERQTDATRREMTPKHGQHDGALSPAHSSQSQLRYEGPSRSNAAGARAGTCAAR